MTVADIALPKATSVAAFTVARVSVGGMVADAVSAKTALSRATDGAIPRRTKLAFQCTWLAAEEAFVAHASAHAASGAPS